VDKLDDVRGGEAVRVQDRLCAAFATASGKQFERPDAVGLEIALAAAGTRESARRASQRSPCGVSRCRNDAIPARSGVNQGFSRASSRAPVGPDAIGPQPVFAIPIKGLVPSHGLRATAGAFCA
jgi:hypothetical protein